MLKWLGILALAGAAFVALMTTGSGRAAESGAAAKGGAAPVAVPAKDGTPAKASTAPSAAAQPAGKDAKPDGVSKTDGKTDDKSVGKTDGKTGNPESAGKTAEAAKTASQETPAQPRRAKSKRKAGDDEPELPPGQGPPPPSPLTVNDLHQEASRDRSVGGEFNAPPRVKLEQLLAEVGKARQSLHDDTLKLEALAGTDLSKEGSAPSDAPAPAVPGAPGQPPQKNPLDVLAKALRGIKPEQAGPIVARLDKGLAATVLLKMPPVDAGKIMGALKPEVAAELATQIAMRAPSSQPGGKR